MDTNSIKAIIKTYKGEWPIDAFELKSKVDKNHDIRDSDFMIAIWTMIDNGEIFWTKDRNLHYKQ